MGISMGTIGELSKTSVEIAVEWRIMEFLSLPVEVNRFYEGPEFSFAGTSWSLRIFPNGVKKNILEDGTIISTEGIIDLFLCRTSPGPPIYLEYSLGLKSLDGKVNLEKHTTHNFEKIEGVGDLDFISRSKLSQKKSELVPSGVLTVVCRMKHLKTADISSHTVNKKCSYCKSTLEDLEELSSHQQKCMYKPIKCPECSAVVALKDWYDHKCQKKEAEGHTVDKKCSYCKSTLEAHEELSSHQQKCMEKPIKCPEYSAVVALKDWSDHCEEELSSHIPLLINSP